MVQDAETLFRLGPVYVRVFAWVLLGSMLK